MATDTLKPFPEPLNRINRLVVDTCKSVTDAQMSSLRGYMELLEDQAGSATAIRDLESIKGFVRVQPDRFNQLVKRMSDDIREFSGIAENFRNEAFEVFREPLTATSEDTVDPKDNES
ncbi:phasin family protein [Marinobacter sp. TBZ242]|uniref:Phasin family protein n=1 Tax=Marinobacter azerbaijanicus TaxID=3050455 RepID=A0ABT7IH25_9GAMM|nr:phasin family protein [Marinobacter sp. TBZ242]MDL0433478.1 phasin family protein [Marinobacter sp. TBZ242]